MRWVASAIAMTIAVSLSNCATAPKQSYAPGMDNAAQIMALSEQLRVAHDEQRAIERAGRPGAQSFFDTQDLGLDRFRTMSSKERREKLVDLAARSVELWGELSERLEVELDAAIAKEFGPRQPLESEEVSLEALDSEGNVVEVPVTVEIRPLRRISGERNSARLSLVFGPGRPALAAYDGVPVRIAAEEKEYFRRIYTGQAAEAIAMEARSIVLLKGGEWRDSTPKKRVANAIAVRGLDMDMGLKDNGNTTYDDTMYVVIEGGGKGTKVVEYRATTESSSTRRGVGRLAASQVTYQRGLHKGKDPAFRLKGDKAQGTRRGREGTYDILGANLHSAYSSRQFDSTTPLSPNVSLGCQVVATSKRSFESNVVKYLEGEGIRHFLYTIVEDDEMQTFEQMLAESSVRSVLVQTIERSS